MICARASMEDGSGGTVGGWRAGAPAMLHCRRVDLLGTRERGGGDRPADQAPSVAVQGWAAWRCTRPQRLGGFLSRTGSGAGSHEIRLIWKRSCRYGAFCSKGLRMLTRLQTSHLDIPICQTRVTEYLMQYGYHKKFHTHSTGN